MSKGKLFFYLIVILGLGYFGFKMTQAYGCPDADNDGLTDCEESRVYFTERFDPDTDNDGFTDGDEIDKKYSPHFGEGKLLVDVDSDGDGLSDGEELKLGTSIIVKNDPSAKPDKSFIESLQDRFIITTNE